MNFWKTFLACLSAIFLGGIISFFFLILVISGFAVAFGTLLSPQTVAHNAAEGTVLNIDMSMVIREKPVDNIFEEMDLFTMDVPKTITIYNIVNAIKKAATDPNIKGICIRTSMTSSSSDFIYQIREALLEFKESQKFIVAYGDVYSQSQYWLSSVADKIYLNPAGAVAWNGLGASVMFYKDMLAKIGVKPEIFRVGTYKSAIEPFILNEMSVANKEQTAALINSMWRQIVEDVSTQRTIKPNTLNKIASNLELFDAKDALAKKMVDELLYAEQFERKIAEMTSQEKPKFLSIHKYAPTTNKVNNSSSNQIALLYASGEITNAGGEGIVGNSLRKEIDKLANNDDIKAVVLRVNSPGGTVLASEIIRYAVSELKSKKPVVVSMGSYAASGGYWISCDADYILASPMTLTGSIGVFGMMMNVKEGANNILGIQVDGVKTNPYASSMQDMFRSTTPFEKMYLQRSVDSIYTNFVSLVATGRNLPYATVNKIASGRVWSGVQALENDLVDEIGTMHDAVAKAAKLANIEGDYFVSQYPKPDMTGIMGILQNSASVITQKIFAPSLESLAFEKIKELKAQQGVQARIPYLLNIE